MDYRKANPDDRPALLSLWEQVFGDGPDFSGRALDIFAGEGNVYVAAQDGAPQAMLLAVPCKLQGREGIYLYGLATQPQARGAGVMTGLMAHAEADKAAAGAAFSVLIPASVPLFDYYRKRGYTVEIALRHTEYLPEPGRAAPEDPDDRPLEATLLAELRDKYLEEPRVSFSSAREELIAADLREEGAWLSISGDAYAVCLRDGDTLLVPELNATEGASARGLLAALLHSTGCARARVSLPAASQLPAGKGKVHPAALLKKLDPDFAPQAPYLRLALDDLAEGFAMWLTRDASLQ